MVSPHPCRNSLQLSQALALLTLPPCPSSQSPTPSTCNIGWREVARGEAKLPGQLWPHHAWPKQG